MMGDRNLFMELRPVSKDRCSHTSLSLTGDFLRSTKLRRSLAHQLNHPFLVNTGNNRLPGAVGHDKAGVQFFDRPGRREAASGGHGVRIVRQAGGSGPLLRSAAQWSAPRLCPFDRSSYSRLGSTPRRCWHVNPRHVVNCVYRVETSEQRAGTAD